VLKKRNIRDQRTGKAKQTQSLCNIKQKMEKK
jgi:hypothetical protein